MYTYKDGELLTAAKLNNTVAEIQTEQTKAIVAAKNDMENAIYVAGKKYWKTGIYTFDNLGGWTTASGIYSYRKLTAAPALAIPPGYAVRFDVVYSEHICFIAGGNMWSNDATSRQSDAYIVRLWNSTAAETRLIIRWEIYKK